MKLVGLFLVLGLLCATHIYVRAEDNFEDNEFAEFENFESEDDDTNFVSVDDEPVLKTKPQQKPVAEPTHKPTSNKNDDFDDDAVVEDDDEFEHFQDEEEFEGFDQSDMKDPETIVPEKEPKLTVAKLPLHFRTHWDSYWMEMLLLAGLSAYFANFFMGKTKNSRIANLWLSTHKQLLDENFALVGDDGKLENENPGLLKESESVFTLWCSGRSCVEGMLVELKMIKRQDLVSLVAGIMRPTRDQVFIRCTISKESMDTFVFAVGSKKTITKSFKELGDLNQFCTLVGKPEERYNVPVGYAILSEVPEATTAILEPRIIQALTKYQDLIDFIHISDQYSGPIQPQEDASASPALKQPDVQRILYAAFNMPNQCDMDEMKPLLVLVFYLLEKMKRYRLSKEGKNKTDKNRQKVQEEFLKSTHAARAEAAATRREEKRKQEKEKVLAEDDPEKQRRWELKEQKRQAKKKAPKMKRLAIKSL